MKALVAGAGGQLGSALAETAPPGVEVRAFARTDLDITDAAAVEEMVRRESPALIVNAAAYTAVDKAESEADKAFAINRDGAAHLARTAAAAGARLVHVSTDFVFDGRSGRPWRPDDPTGPLNVYGASKLAGEASVRAAGGKALIVRTAWVYAHRGANFLLTMLRVLKERGEARVVADQVGAPTSALSLARGLWRLATGDVVGVLHLTDAGVASWYDFAQAIAEEAQAAGFLAGAVKVIPIASGDWPSAAVRPAFSVLDCAAAWPLIGGPPPHWRIALREVLARVPRS
ncbi:MAG TPA: dTDP-4-dehydrorhamnose reductase [Caulobacteraceae bacterium]|nr:dTDP-4-dehydrorhamnose reductase [Caulobacteraceae bacterium]